MRLSFWDILGSIVCEATNSGMASTDMATDLDMPSGALISSCSATLFSGWECICTQVWPENIDVEPSDAEGFWLSENVLPADGLFMFGNKLGFEKQVSPAKLNVTDCGDMNNPAMMAEGTRVIMATAISFLVSVTLSSQKRKLPSLRRVTVNRGVFDAEG